MLFAHDTDVALGAAAALVNTANEHPDSLPDIAGLDAFVRSWGWTGARTGTSQELAEVTSLRPRLRRLWEVDAEEAVAIVNALLQEYQALPQLVRHGEWDYHLHATSLGAPLAARMAVEAAMAFVDVIRMGEIDRLRVCAAEDCNDVLVDQSKNRSRRFCDSGCGNRANVAAYRARQAGTRISGK